jgi:hypothetical protein
MTRHHAARSNVNNAFISVLPCAFRDEDLQAWNAHQVRITRDRYFDLLNELFPVGEPETVKTFNAQYTPTPHDTIVEKALALVEGDLSFRLHFEDGTTVFVDPDERYIDQNAVADEVITSIMRKENVDPNDFFDYERMCFRGVWDFENFTRALIRASTFRTSFTLELI